MMWPKFLKIIWILFALAVLAVTLQHDAPEATNDIGIFLAYGMLALTFPLGLIAIALIALLALLQEQWGLSISILDQQYVGFSGMWLVFFIAGYMQWFVLLPWLWRKWKTKRAQQTAQSKKLRR